MNSALEQFATYATANRLAPEPTKTQVMYSTSRQNIKHMKRIRCKMLGHELETSKEIKVLGFSPFLQTQKDERVSEAGYTKGQ